MGIIVVALLVAPRFAHGWSEADFERRSPVAYPIPTGRNDIVGTLQSYTIRKGDTLLDVGRWFGVSATEISDANDHLDWWAPPVGKTILIPTEHILPARPYSGIVVNVPELRLYYYYPTPVHGGHRRIRKAKFTHTAYLKGHDRARRAVTPKGVHPVVVYTFPVGLGRYDWRTPIGKTFRVTAKEHNPAWIVPNDIYEEHLERDGYADHMIPGGDPDNPEGHWRLDLNMPEYAIHGTNNPWGVGMEVSHGCIRLDPEAIDRLWHMVPVGMTGRILYQPVKYGWRGNSLYVEVHEDLYGKYPGLWRHAITEAKRQNLVGYIDTIKLEKAVEEKTGVPTYVMPGPEPPGAMPPTSESASSAPLPPPGSAAAAPDIDTGTGAETGASAAAKPSGGAAIAPAATPRTADASAAENSGTDESANEDPAADNVPADAPAATVSGGTAANAAGGGNAAGAAGAPSDDKTRGWHRLPAGALPIE